MTIKSRVDFVKDKDGATVVSAVLRFASDDTALSFLTMLARRIQTELAYETWDGLTHVDHYANAKDAMCNRVTGAIYDLQPSACGAFADG